MLVTERATAQASCPECRSSNLVRDKGMGEFICGVCGLVIQENIVDPGPEWRTFTTDSKIKVRAGPPTKYSHFNKGLATLIPTDRDSLGRPLQPKVRQQIQRLRRWQNRSNFRDYRNLIQAMNELQRLSEKLNITSSVQELAAIFYRKTLNKGLVQGRSIEGVVAASLWAACRFTKTPRTLREIADASLRDKIEISRTYRMIVQKLKLKMPVNDPLDHVTKIAEKAKVPSCVEGLAIKLIREAKKKHATMGKDPAALAAAALYVSAKLKKEKVTQSKLAKAAEICEVTIRSIKKSLEKSLNLNYNVTNGTDSV